jgi:predicted transcriptional regulator
MSSSAFELTLEQVRELSSPIRVSIFATLRMRGPQSIRELANFMGVRPDSLYYHMRILEQVGIIELVETRQSTIRQEAVYGLKHRQFTMPARDPSPEFAEALHQLVEASLGRCVQLYASAARKLASKPELAEVRDFHMINGRLSPDHFEDWKRRLEDLMKEALVDEGDDGVPIMCCAIVAPAQ